MERIFFLFTGEITGGNHEVRKKMDLFSFCIFPAEATVLRSVFHKRKGGFHRTRLFDKSPLMIPDFYDFPC
jgi:hypothetical protein